MNVMLGIAYFASIFVLTAVVASVYSTAQEAHLALPQIVRHAFRRAGKLLGVLGILAVAVYLLTFLGRM